MVQKLPRNRGDRLDWYVDDPSLDVVKDYEMALADAAKGNERAQRYIAALMKIRMES